MRLLIAIPTSKYIESSTFKSIYDLSLPSNWTADFDVFSGYQVDIIRNQIANKSLNYDRLFFVDSDIVLPKDALIRLSEHDVDIVSGVYNKKLAGFREYEFYIKNEKKRYVAQTLIPNVSLLDVDGVGLGCCLIKTDIFKKIPYPYFLNTLLSETERPLSEDLYFCRKSKLHGYSLKLDTRVVCGHLGSIDFRQLNKSLNTDVK
jgi:hypothetical protein